MRIFSPPLFALLIVLSFCGGSLVVSDRPFHIPDRESFSLFPMRILTWQGTRDQFSREIVDALKVQDYLLANYQGSSESDKVNLYIAYYQTQSLGSAAHSPRTCIPGDGWEIESLSRVTVGSRDFRLTVNRAIIAKGQVRQLVYYWFDQRGRILASEYSVKWYLFVDGLMTRRTDGALIRGVTAIDGRDVTAADTRLGQFVAEVYPRLGPFLPR